MSTEFFSDNLLPPNPNEIAIQYATELSRADFEHTPNDAKVLEQLEEISTHLGFLGSRYFVEGTRSFVIPVDTDEPEVNYASYYGTTFEGVLVSYSRVTIGKIIGHNSVSALCLAFDNAFLLPTFEHTHPAELLHVPAFAINSITRVS
jgi:hypothetical protein